MLALGSAAAALASYALGRRRGAKCAARERSLRAEERAGRVRAERALRAARQRPQAQQAQPPCAQQAQPRARASEAQYVTYRPLGVLRSVFDERNGCPRQPLLAAQARAVLTLRPGVAAGSLEGLDVFSHAWVLYAFNHNTDEGTSKQSNNKRGYTPKAKVAVPRLNGQLRGALATRTPHRPCALGLSVGTVESVSTDKAGRGVLVMGGLDCVDGTVVLDVKPYVPFVEALPSARAPEWVDRALPGEEAPVRWVEGAKQSVEAAWSAPRRKGRASLLSGPAALCTLVEQVLARDIRSAYRRRVDGADGAQHSLVLDGVRIEYALRGEHGASIVGAAQPSPVKEHTNAKP